jgi:hypothetical protein
MVPWCQASTSPPPSTTVLRWWLFPTSGFLPCRENKSPYARRQEHTSAVLFNFIPSRGLESPSLQRQHRLPPLQQSFLTFRSFPQQGHGTPYPWSSMHSFNGHDVDIRSAAIMPLLHRTRPWRPEYGNSMRFPLVADLMTLPAW